MFKVFRMGHRLPNKGVITIASLIDNEKIFYGASFCSPKEKFYDKQFGIKLASERLSAKQSADKFVPLSVLQHNVVLLDIIGDLFESQEYPLWAEQLLIDNIMYPVGLARYKKSNKEEFMINSIEVDSEFSKEQLLIASSYLHNLPEVDKEFMAVNLLSHLYLNPELITVK